MEWPHHKATWSWTWGRQLVWATSWMLSCLLKPHAAHDDLWAETSIKCNVRYHAKRDEVAVLHCWLSRAWRLCVRGGLDGWVFGHLAWFWHEHSTDCGVRVRVAWKKEAMCLVFMPSSSIANVNTEVEVACCTWRLSACSSLQAALNFFSSSRYFCFSFSLSFRSVRKSSLKTSA